jgi:hypothetical protein
MVVALTLLGDFRFRLVQTAHVGPGLALATPVMTFEVGNSVVAVLNDEGFAVIVSSPI